VSPGFTLVEMLIVLVVVAILGLVALPAFNDAIRKGRRSDAVAALTAVQQAQERWRGNHSSYTTSLSDLNLESLGDGSASGYYSIAIQSVADGDAMTTRYIATAYGKDGKSQAGDADCRRMGVLVSGGEIKYAGCGACSSFSLSDFATTHVCWAK
jgi:type IV pilus assembly protein PilE